MEAIVVSASEAAAMLKTDKGKVLTLLDKGEIPGYREGTNWKIPKRLLLAYVENRAIESAKVRRHIARESEKGELNEEG